MPSPDQPEGWQKLLTDTVASLARLSLRIKRMPTQRRYPTGYWQMHPPWSVDDLEPKSPWFAELDNMSLDGAFGRMLVAQYHLTGMLSGTQPFDAMKACMAIQHVTGSTTGGAWTSMTRRFAQQLGVDLPNTPRDVTAGLCPFWNDPAKPRHSSER